MFHIILDGKSTRSIQNVLKKEFQRLYSDETAIIQLDDICCPHCGKKGSLRHHGFYMRRLIVCGICFTVSIHRLRCYECGHTHALMPSFIIPYEKKFCIDLLSLLNERHYDFRKNYPDLSSNDIMHLRHKYSSLASSFSTQNILSDVIATCDQFIKVSETFIHKRLFPCFKSKRQIGNVPGIPSH